MSESLFKYSVAKLYLITALLRPETRYSKFNLFHFPICTTSAKHSIYLRKCKGYFLLNFSFYLISKKLFFYTDKILTANLLQHMFTLSNLKWFSYFKFHAKFHSNTLSANLTKWSSTLKQFVGNLPTNCLSVFDHFVGLALKGLPDYFAMLL